MPVVIDLGAVFIAFCAFVVCWALLQAYSATLGALLGHLADLSRSVSVAGVHVFGWLGDGLDKINHFVMLQMGNAVEGTAWAWHKLIGQLAAFIHETARVVNAVAVASGQAWDYAWAHGIPRMILNYLNPVWVAIKALQALAHELERVGRTTTKTVTHVVTHDLPRITVHVTEQAAQATKVAVKAGATAAVGTLPRIGALEREIRGIDETAKDAWRKITSTAVFTGLVAVALSRLGLEWLRCSNYQRFGKRICQIHPNVLEDFLLGLTAIFGTLSLVAFAKQVQGVFDDGAQLAVHFWRADVPGPGGDRQLGSPTTL